MDFHLINLDCASCGSAMTAGPHDILFICAHCGSGAVLGDTGLESIDSVALMPTPGRRASLWRSGWSIEADVVVKDRRSWRQVTPGWSGRRQFIIPAFPLPLEDLTLLSKALSSYPGANGEIPKEPCHGGTLDLVDAMVFIRFLVVGEEVQKPDNLSTVEVEITPVSQRIIALPFDTSSGRLQCAVTGTVVRSE